MSKLHLSGITTAGIIKSEYESSLDLQLCSPYTSVAHTIEESNRKNFLKVCLGFSIEKSFIKQQQCVEHSIGR